MLKIVADNAIPFAERQFSRIGDVHLVNGRQINSSIVEDADVLVCRTITKVNRVLLHDSSLKIVASPTSGSDHVDLDYLNQRSISFCCAPGSNARSVAEYVLSALSVLAEQKAFKLSDKTIGIIGCGNVGSQLRDFARTIGLKPLVYDPLLAEASGDNEFCELAAIQRCDIISVHVPLTRDTPYPTHKMLNARFFQGLAENVIFINTARGEVLDQTELKNFLQKNARAMAVLDVWENEPEIDMSLLTRADIATPHIAGYSMDSKLRATNSVFDQVCETLNVNELSDDNDMIFQPGEMREISLHHNQPDIDAITLAILASYDVRSDAAALRHVLEDSVVDSAAYFDDLRNNYPIRREFSSMQIALTKQTPSLRQKLLNLGFRLIGSD